MKVKGHSNLIYALKDGEIVGIQEAQSGLKCGCYCPACGGALVAKKGEKMMHHFSHYVGHNCEYGYESSLHLAAKDILSKAKRMVLPSVYIDFPDSYKKSEKVCDSVEIEIEKVELEKRYNDVIPDIVVYVGGKQLFVEIYVTHAIDDIKLQKIKDANISTIEIDLSKMSEDITMEALSEILLSNSEEKKWKYNALANKRLNDFYEVSDKREIINRGMALHVDYCPIKSRVWKGKPYANLTDDCLCCEYCIFAGHENILCSGRLRISSIKDFSIPVEKRIKDSEDVLDDLREISIVAGRCPNCGGKLMNRKSQYGEFLGCSNYPHCRFMVYTDPKTGVLKTKA